MVLVVGALLVAIVGSGGVGAAKVIDRSNGSFAGYLWFVYSDDATRSQQPFAAVAVGRLPEAHLEQAFGVQSVAGDLFASPLEAATVGELELAGRTVLAVQVGPAAFDEIRHLVASWPDRDHGPQDAARVAENLLDRAARRAGLKVPYRSALSGSDPISYLRDLDRTNP